MKPATLRHFFLDQGGFAESVTLVYAVGIADFAFSFVSNLAVPFVATQLDFANYRTLVLYSSYAGFVHFGLLSGFYLYVVGRRNDEVDYRVVVATRRILVALQLIALPLALIILNAALPQVNALVVFAIVIAWGIANFVTLYNYLLQGTNRFRLYTLVNLASRIVAILLMGYLVLRRTVTTNNLILAFLSAPIVALTLYVLLEQLLKVFLYSCDEQKVEVVPSVGSLWKRGVVLQLANMSLALLFTIDNLSVSLFFGSIQFAYYAFAYGLTSVIYLAVDGLAVATTPYIARILRTKTVTPDASYFSSTVLIWLTPLSYWGGQSLISRLFPQYAEVTPLLFFFAAALPFGTFIRSRLVSVLTASGREKALLGFGAAGLLMTILLVVVSVALQHTITSVAAGWSLALVLTGVFGGIFFTRYLPERQVSEQTRSLCNALFATVLFVFCASQAGNRQFLPIYLFGMVFALWYNWRILCNMQHNHLL